MHNSFRQHLTELFEQPFPVFKVDEGHTTASYSYKIGGGEREDYMVVNFGYINPDEEEWDMDFTRGGSTSLTGEGQASRVFATVMDAFKRFTKRYYAKTVAFTAQKSELHAKTLSYRSGSRVSLYHSLIKRYAAQAGYRLMKTDELRKGVQVLFVLERINKL
jgi:hypothetical protein